MNSFGWSHKQVLAFAFASGLVLAAAQAAHAAAAVLVGAPTPTCCTSWVSQANIPPSGPISDFAAQFSLSSNQYVSAITIFSGGLPLDTNSSTSQLDLVTSLTSTVPLYSTSFSSPTSNMTITLPVDSTLAVGTYYLRLEATGWVGWWASDGSFVTAAGSVADGMWETTAGSPWVFASAAAESFDHPGVFSVLGSSVPEPATWLMIISGLGLVGLGGAVARVRARQSG